MSENPLVSVIVVCYNAADYIIETLESVKAQTYKNIELIVSDDCSTDCTLEIVRSWIDDNKSVFVRSDVLTITHNTGVSANYNRAVKECRGEWIKNIDGDDLITPNCIEDNLEFISNHPECKLLFSNVSIFSTENKARNRFFFDKEKKKFFLKDSQEQFKSLLKANILPSQSAFINACVLKDHPYNEKYKALEDAPMWIYLTRDGVRAFYFDKCTALYRKGESLSSSTKKFFSPIYLESLQTFFWNEKICYIKKYDLKDAYDYNRKSLFIIELADVLFHNKRTIFNNILFKLISVAVSKFTKFRI